MQSVMARARCLNRMQVLLGTVPPLCHAARVHMAGVQQTRHATTRMPYLIHGKHLALVELGNLFLRQVPDAARSGHHQVHWLVEAHDVILQGGSTSRHHDLDAHVPGKFFRNLACLESQLSCGDDDHRCSRQNPVSTLTTVLHSCLLWTLPMSFLGPGFFMSFVRWSVDQNSQKTKMTQSTSLYGRTPVTGWPWMQFWLVSILFRMGIVKAAVFPVPFLALARMSRPDKATGILSSCMGEGFSNPFS